MLTLALKEIRNSLLTLRFQVGTALALVLVATAVWALADDFGRRLEGHSRRLALNEAHLSEFGHLNRIGSVALVGEPPPPLTAWVRGLSQGSQLEHFDNDPLPVLFPLVDLLAVLGVVFSLLAVVFTFDAVSGERRAGTLRALTTFRLSRPQLVLGKLLGAGGTVAVPWLASWLVAALVVAVAGPAPWGAGEWAAAAALGLGGLLYVLGFAALGVMLSALTREPRGSALAGLAAWVLLVLVIPNLAPFVAAELRPLPSLTALQRQTSRMLDEERDALQDRLRAEAAERLRAEDPKMDEYLALRMEERAAALAADPELARAAERWAEAAAQAIREGNRIQGERVEELERDFERRLDGQVRLAQSLSLISPAPALTYLATDMAETGLRYGRRLEAQREAFGVGFDRWVREAEEAWRRTDPERDWWNTPVDLSGMPRFVYRSEPVSGRLSATAPWFAALALFVALFSGLAVLAFHRYDVR